MVGYVIKPSVKEQLYQEVLLCPRCEQCHMS